MLTRTKKHEVGELRPSQLLFTYGVGSIIDLPYLSAMVMGLEDWEVSHSTEIGENRLLQAVKHELGTQVSQLNSPRSVAETSGSGLLSDEKSNIGVPVGAFPRWLLCPRCRLLASLESDNFELKPDRYRPDRVQYVHSNCTRSKYPPAVVPARFLVACETGHLDDFPWVHFVHGGPTDCHYVLRLKELGPSGEAAAIQVECECGKRRRMSDAFGLEGQKNLPPCTGRRPHLRDFADQDCPVPTRTISLGASNSWFPIILSVLAVPVASASKLDQLVNEHWHILEKALNPSVVAAFRAIGQLPFLAPYSDAEIWATVERKHKVSEQPDAQTIKPADLKIPEWQVFVNPTSVPTTRDFQATLTSPPAGYETLIRQVVLVEKLREVQALTGFTRIESPSNYTNVEEIPNQNIVPLLRGKPTWVPAAEVRGEGIFIEFNETQVQKWVAAAATQLHNRAFREAFRKWRQRRMLDPNIGYPGIRYTLLHSFSHALMRQLALECGYSAASIRERIYSLDPTAPDGPMAGVLLYTAASDSEGTLGGLVSLGSSQELGRHIDEALEQMLLCASDPLCAEHAGNLADSLHGAVCHACLFIPETSCERGNKYLDRSVLVQTMYKNDLAFFG